MLSCKSPSNGIILQGNSNNNGSTINLHSKNIDFDTSTCKIDTTHYSTINDIIWLHAVCHNNNIDNCSMNIGNNTVYSSYYTLSDEEINIIKLGTGP